ncbi:hypothetical protein [Ottowia sp. VDI28]|uniref:hypothetical protein n=1 Tax=Ottowia sp. VDI28 TaxID=3133968 RepID=UPI003C2CA4D9
MLQHIQKRIPGTATTSSVTLGISTVPTSSDGDSLIDYSISITPRRPDSTLRVGLFIPFGVTTVTGAGVRFALFRSGELNAFFATTTVFNSNQSISLEASLPADGGAPITILTRWGVSSGAAYLNRSSTVSSYFGGNVMASLLSVQELASN